MIRISNVLYFLKGGGAGKMAPMCRAKSYFPFIDPLNSLPWRGVSCYTVSRWLSPLERGAPPPPFFYSHRALLPGEFLYRILEDPKRILGSAPVAWATHCDPILITFPPYFHVCGSVSLLLRNGLSPRRSCVCVSMPACVLGGCNLVWEVLFIHFLSSCKSKTEKLR